MKISIIGAGNVGSTLAFALVLKGFCEHLVLANRNITKAQGDVLDLQHSLAFCERKMHIESSPIEAVTGSDILAITVSAPLSPPLSNRMQLGPANVELFKRLIPVLAQNNPDAIFIILSNPVDVLTYLVNRITQIPASKILGVGTLVDSARFRTALSAHEQIHPDDLRAYILGEHGPSQFPVFSHATAGSEQILDNALHRRICNEITHAGFEVLNFKGYTNYAIAAAACEVIRAIVYDSHRTMPISTYFKEWQGIADNCFSIPAVVGRTGIIRHLNPDLNAEEVKALQKTAALVKEHINCLLGCPA